MSEGTARPDRLWRFREYAPGVLTKRFFRDRPSGLAMLWRSREECRGPIDIHAPWCYRAYVCAYVDMHMHTYACVWRFCGGADIACSRRSIGVKYVLSRGGDGNPLTRPLGGHHVLRY